jgi:hypothetical protein
MDERAREQALVAEALRLCDRYLNEIVLAFGLCPWAEAVVRSGALGRWVLPAADPSPRDCLAAIDAWTTTAGDLAEAGHPGEAGPRAGASRPPVEVGFVLLPRHTGSRGAFDSFAEAVRRADRARRTPDEAVPFLIAAFHPKGARTFTGPPQLVSFLRRTPDPTLQLVRADLLDRVKTVAPGVSDQIAARNFATLGDAASAARFEAVVRLIRADRDAAYARLGLPPAPGGHAAP